MTLQLRMKKKKKGGRVPYISIAKQKAERIKIATELLNPL